TPLGNRNRVIVPFHKGDRAPKSTGPVRFVKPFLRGCSAGGWCCRGAITGGGKPVPFFGQHLSDRLWPPCPRPEAQVLRKVRVTFLPLMVAVARKSSKPSPLKSPCSTFTLPVNFFPKGKRGLWEAPSTTTTTCVTFFTFVTWMLTTG